jgi:broad specificity phosphatase PhoE
VSPAGLVGSRVMTRVFWVRHGENVANLSRTFSHRVFDGDLTDRGRDQALALARSLADSGVRFTEMWASPLRRARQTAEILGLQLDLGLAGDLDEFREVNVGELDGRNDAEAWATYGEVLADWRHGNLDRRFPGGENGHELATRISSALHRLASATAGAILVVAHGANIRAAIPPLTGTPDPGTDMGTATAAELEIHPTSMHVNHWPVS